MLKFTLNPNLLSTDDLNDYMARTVDVKINKRVKLISDITGPGSILKPTECNAVLDAVFGQIKTYISQGEAYKDDIMTIRPDIQGVFNGEDDRFDPERHNIVPNIVPNASLKKAALSIETQYVKVSEVKPVIESVYDWGSDTTDQHLTAGGIVEITGDQLKIHEEPGGQGVFFLNTDNGTETPAPRPRINEPKTLTLKLPALPSGNYRIEIRNTARNGKTIRSSVSSSTFVVS